MLIKIVVFLSILSSLYLNTSSPKNDCHFHHCLTPKMNYMTEETFLNDFVQSQPSLETTPLSSEQIQYFQNLFTYSPQNSHGSCGYVSFIQYLSYYDCFYNDSIIPEQYERNQGSTSTLSLARSVSPGVLKQAYPGTSLELYSFINSNMNTDYQMLLMHIVNESLGRAPAQYGPSIGMWNYHYIVDTISEFNNASFTYARVQDFGSGALPTDPTIISWFDSYVKSELDDGNPVMLHIAQYNSTTGEYDNYHSVVAYYYDSLGIHANFGWSYLSSTDMVVNSSYQITEAGVIDFSNVAQTHSNNFIVNDIGYCGCGNHIIHDYSDSFDYYSPDQHKAYCKCGAYELRFHAIDPDSIYIVFGRRYAECLDCGEEIDLGIGGGIIIPGPHSSNTMVSDNGSYILQSGILIIVKKDLESYFAGTLVFHPLGELTV